MELATGIGMAGSIVLALFGLVASQSLVLMIAVFGYANCWYARRRLREEGDLSTGEFGYDFSQGYTAFEQDTDPKPGFWARRKARRAAAKAAQRRQEEQQRQRTIETTLRKVSEEGLESLTKQERQVLEQETDRQRQAGESAKQPRRPA